MSLSLSTLEVDAFHFWIGVVTPDFTKIVSGHANGVIKVWDLENGQELLTFFSSNSMVNCLVVTSDAQKIIFADFDIINVWNLENGQELLAFSSNSMVNCLGVTFDGTKIVSGHINGVIKVWHLDMGECLYTFINDTPITAIVISPDGKKVIAGDEAGRLHFLELIV